MRKLQCLMNIMLHLTVIVTLLYCLTSCSSSEHQPLVIDNRISPPEPDKDLRDKYEAQQSTKATACILDNPDTSLSNIKLRDTASATTVLKVTPLKGDTAYNFYSKDRRELLSVKVHPGYYYSQVSIFQVKHASGANIEAASLSIDNFTTEKNIKLGLSKKEVVSRLGNVIQQVTAAQVALQ